MEPLPVAVFAREKRSRALLVSPESWDRKINARLTVFLNDESLRSLPLGEVSRGTRKRPLPEGSGLIFARQKDLAYL